MPLTDDQYMLIEYVYYKDPLGNLYPLFGGSRTLLSWSGAGNPPIKYLSDKGPNQHGRTIRDYRYQERRITLSLYDKGCIRADFWKKQTELIKAIRPNKSSTNETGYLLFISPTNVEREIPARIDAGPRGDWDGLGSQTPADLRETLSFICDDPFFRDPDQQSVIFTVSPTGSCLPTCLPACLGGAGIINTTKDILYTGTWEGDQIEIDLIGPMTSPIIKNTVTGKEIKFNYTISAGEKVTIKIAPPQVTVTNNSGINLIGVIDDISDLVDFALTPISNLTETGINTIRVTASGADSSTTSIEIKYYIRDISIYAEG